MLQREIYILYLKYITIYIFNIIIYHDLLIVYIDLIYINRVFYARCIYLAPSEIS